MSLENPCDALHESPRETPCANFFLPPVPSLRLRLIRSPALASDAVIGFIAAGSVLDRKRKLLGYIDVAALKAEWEAGQADPVSLVSYPALGQTLY